MLKLTPNPTKEIKLLLADGKEVTIDEGFAGTFENGRFSIVFTEMNEEKLILYLSAMIEFSAYVINQLEASGNVPSEEDESNRTS